jgi:hypothetical protein
MNYRVILLFTIVSLVFVIASAGEYRYKTGLVITAPDFKTAARLCFTILTNNKYPGEERGLEIIDTCANPIIKGKR